jgi:ribonucleoside-triphosphate reductase
MDKSLAVLSDVTIFQKYSRYMPEFNRRENWDEIVNRWSTMLINRYPYLQDEIESVSNKYVRNKLVLPSMRALQFAGKPIERNPVRQYNCCYQPVNCVEAFKETMFLLLSGVGVGYSVQMHHVEQLPVVVGPNNYVRYVIQDSIEGWSDAIEALFEAYYFGAPKPIWDFSEIRPQGARLKVSGGKAPGPKPLAKALAAIEKILKSSVNKKLTSLQVHDSLCHIAVAVLSGGIRRSAMIACFSPEDDEMSNCKAGEWWVKNPQRGKANNSMVFLRSSLTRERFDAYWNVVKKTKSGEPGIIITNSLESLYNPCVEASLEANQFCNLCEVNAAAAETQEHLEGMVAAAALIGTLQAGFTDFHYLRPVWRETTEKDALLGVSLTGIASMNNNLDLERAAGVAVSVNKHIASQIGINPAARVTCVKPSGSTSLVMGTSSGVHGWHDKFYIRRMRMNKMEALYGYLVRRMPELIEDSVYDETDAVISLPVKIPSNGQTQEEPAVDFLERVKRVHRTWIKGGHIRGINSHNVSATVVIDEHEWDEVGDWLFNNKDCYAGMSVLPKSDHTYQQMPHESISEDKYNEMMNLVRKLDLTQAVEKDDNTDRSDQVACAGGACLI